LKTTTTTTTTLYACDCSRRVGVGVGVGVVFFLSEKKSTDEKDVVVSAKARGILKG
jgi:hypothetical protein